MILDIDNRSAGCRPRPGSVAKSGLIIQRHNDDVVAPE